MASPQELADTVQRYLTPRAKELALLTSYVNLTQYDGRPDWFTDTGVPLSDRKPCINAPVVRSAIRSHSDFVLGEGRWPALTTGTSEDDSLTDDAWGLSEEDSARLDRFINVMLTSHTRLKSVAREMLMLGEASRSVAVVVSVRQGRIFVETVRAQWCTPTLHADGECESIEIQYPYIETSQDPQSGRWLDRVMIYKRVIDAVQDRVWIPVEAKANGRPPQWGGLDAKQSGPHGLGFCPVRWYAHLKPSSATNEIDGVAIHELQLGEIDALNRSLSQRHRAARLQGDPQMWETGVGADENPAPMGETARAGIVNVKTKDGEKSGTNVFGIVGARPRYMARKRGAGIINSYQSKDAKVGLLTLEAGALTAIDNDAKDIRSKLSEAFSHVIFDPMESHGKLQLSGKALSYIFARELGYCDTLRQDFGDNALIPLVSMLLRVVLVVGRKDPKALYVAGVSTIVPILERFERDVAGGGTAWIAPRIDAVWGPYFPPNELDQQAVVTLVVAALEGGVITLQMAVEKLRDSGVFPVGSSESIVKAITDERAKRQQDAMTQMHSAGDALRGTKPASVEGDQVGGESAQ